MSFSLFISRKFTFSKKDSKFITFISTISVIGITLGVATLIIALSILNGFEKTLTNKIITFDSHIQISSYQSILPDYKENSKLIKYITGKYLSQITPYASQLAIISSKKRKEGVSIKGISSENDSIAVKKNIVDGKFNLDDKKNKSIIIGKKLADKLLIKVGNEITVFALSNDKIPSPENLPNIMKFKVTGIFESGMAEYDDLYAYVNLRNAQYLFSIGNNITGYDIKLNNISKIDSLTGLLSAELRYPHVVKSIYQTHRNIFTWIELQKEPVPIILGLIIIVAVFNIIGTLLMVVLEKTNAIGTLKSLGARKKQIISIFVFQAGFLGIVGIILGNLLAFILMFIQMEFNIISLPSSVYFMSTVPILLKPENFLLVSILTFILCLIVSLIPSFIASRIKPVSTLRFN